MTDTQYSWRHGWIPLTMRAALQKTRGDHDAAAALLGEARRRRRGRGPVEFVTPAPAHQAEHTERAALRSLSDDQLAEQLGMERTTPAGVAAIVAELDRRDRAERRAARDRDRRAARRQARDAARWDAYEAAVDAGTDATSAYAQAFGQTEEKVRRDEATAALRSTGYRGKNFAELVRAAHRDHVLETFDQAEEETRGNMLNKAGQAAGIHPRTLFAGPESRARKYASEELLGYWQRVGRLTVDDFAAGILGGHMRSASTAYWA